MAQVIPKWCLGHTIVERQSDDLIFTGATLSQAPRLLFNFSHPHRSEREPFCSDQITKIILFGV